MADAHQAIEVVARRTGLNAHVIRIWEKRYGAVEPERTGTNRRLYSDEQIERLSLLRDITQNGHSIGHVAKLPTEKLRELSKESHGTNGHAELWLPRPRAEVFAFFADAHNLQTLTPPWLTFEVLTPAPIAMQPGALMDYRIRVHGLPIRWRTEITEWSPPHHLVDQQLRGPYTLWHHTHTFDERDGGTLCIDDVRYRPHGAMWNESSRTGATGY